MQDYHSTDTCKKIHTRRYLTKIPNEDTRKKIQEDARGYLIPTRRYLQGYVLYLPDAPYDPD